MPVGSRRIIAKCILCYLSRFLLASKWTSLTGQSSQTLRLFYSRFESELIYFENFTAADLFPS